MNTTTSPPQPKPKVVQIATRDGILYILYDDGRLFEACTGTGIWKQIPLPQ